MKPLMLLLTLLTLSCSYPISLKLADVQAALRSLPITNTVIYTAETDPNKLLGRPNQYIEKMSFTDSRIEPVENSVKCSVEVFASEGDAEARKKYIDAIGKAASPFTEYSFVHKNVLLRLDKSLTPEQADEYRRALDKL
jgi:hypothetical protein